MRKVTVLLILVFMTGSVFSQESSRLIQFDSVRIAAQGALPLADFADVTTMGFGVEGEGRFKLASVQELRILAEAGGLYYLTDLDTVDYILSLSLALGAGWQMSFMDGKLGVLPSLSYGPMLHMASGDSLDVFTDTALTAGAEISYQVSEFLSLSFKPAYSIFLEEDTNGQQFILSLGAVFQLKEGE